MRCLARRPTSESGAEVSTCCAFGEGAVCSAITCFFSPNLDLYVRSDFVLQSILSGDLTTQQDLLQSQIFYSLGTFPNWDASDFLESLCVNDRYQSSRGVRNIDLFAVRCEGNPL